MFSVRVVLSETIYTASSCATRVCGSWNQSCKLLPINIRWLKYLHILGEGECIRWAFPKCLFPICWRSSWIIDCDGALFWALCFLTSTQQASIIWFRKLQLRSMQVIFVGIYCSDQLACRKQNWMKLNTRFSHFKRGSFAFYYAIKWTLWHCL